MDSNLTKNFNEDQRLAVKLSGLLHKVLQFHDIDSLSQIVLHELGHEDSFNFKKATYLVDNPDFDHLLGVAGFSNEECYMHAQDLWENPHSFAKDMENATYHNHVKSFLDKSLKRNEINLDSPEELKQLGSVLGLSSPKVFRWNMKHGNHGLLLFEDQLENGSHWKKTFLYNVAGLLSFCGI